MKKANFSKRLGFAIKGIQSAFRRESSFRAHVLGIAFILIASLILRAPLIWCALFAVCVCAVLTLELLNSSLEAFADLIHPAHHPEIGFIKDAIAGAVLIASFTSVIVFVMFLVARNQV